LRAGEVVRLKVKRIESAQRMIRVEQSKSRKDRNVMLSPDTSTHYANGGRRVGVSIPQLPWRSAGCFQAEGPVSR
jgi:integrase-like protein